jgi:hypothetical protein
MGQLTGLQFLWINDCAWLSQLAWTSTLTNLQTLIFFRCSGLTDVGCEALMMLPLLKYLVLVGCKRLTPGIFPTLASLTSLTELSLIGTGWDNPDLNLVPQASLGLESLASLSDLRTLFLEAPCYSEQAIERLRSRLPSLHVTFTVPI